VPLIDGVQVQWGCYYNNWCNSPSAPGTYTYTPGTYYYRRPILLVPLIPSTVSIDWKESGIAKHAVLDTSTPIANITGDATGTVNLSTGAWTMTTNSNANVDTGTFTFTYQPTTRTIATRDSVISPTSTLLGPNVTDVESGSQNPCAGMTVRQALGTVASDVAALPAPLNSTQAQAASQAAITASVGNQIPTAAQNATQTELQIMDETDSRAVLAAIVAKIQACDTLLDVAQLAAIASACKTAIEAGGSSLAAVLAVAQKFAFDGSSNVKSSPQTPVQLATTQPNYAPAKAGDVQVTVTPTIKPTELSEESVAAIRNGLSTLKLPDLAIDGVAFEKAMAALLATSAGRVALTTNNDGTITATFKRQDGSTTALVITYNPATFARSGTGTIP
jgi:hypothetical protein